jgi:hypothetical protein
MVSQEIIKPLKVSGVVKAEPWRPAPTTTHEESWFDNFTKVLYVDFRESCATCLRIPTWNNGLSTERWNEVLQAMENLTPRLG